MAGLVPLNVSSAGSPAPQFSGSSITLKFFSTSGIIPTFDLNALDGTNGFAHNGFALPLTGRVQTLTGLDSSTEGILATVGVTLLLLFIEIISAKYNRLAPSL